MYANPDAISSMLQWSDHDTRSLSGMVKSIKSIRVSYYRSCTRAAILASGMIAKRSKDSSSQESFLLSGTCRVDDMHMLDGAKECPAKEWQPAVSLMKTLPN
jgi:hypothetical protein